MSASLSLLKFSGRKTLPITLQTEMAECGLACLSMVAAYHGYEADLTSLRHKYPISLKGVTLKSLMDISDKMGMAARALRLDIGDMDKLQRPAVLHWDMNHFVVLKSVGNQKITIHDPAQGERVLSFDEVSKHFTGVALELTPTRSFEPKVEQQRLHLSDFWRNASGLKRGLIQLLLLSVVLQAFALISPFYMQLVVDEVIVSHDADLLKVLAWGFLLLALIKLSTDALRSYVILHISNMLSFQMGVNLFRHLVRLPMDFFEKRHIGDVVSRFGSLNQVQELLTTGVVTAIVDGAMAITTLVMMIIYAPVLAVVVTVVVAIYGIIRYALYRPLRQLTEEGIVAKAKEDSNFMESIRGIQSIKIFGREADRQTLWQNRYAEVVNTGIRLGKVNIAYSTINNLLFGLENVLVIYLGAQLVLDNAFSVGMLYAFISYKGQFTDKTVALIEKLIEFKMLGLHLNRIADIALTEKEKALELESVRSEPIEGNLALKGISYRYSESEPCIFENVSMSVAQGESVAIIGPSGCGKTTLMKVMMGLFEASAGTLLVDGKELDSSGVRNFRSQVAAVMQDDQLLSGTVADNICFFDSTPDLERIEYCGQLASIHHDIEAMPMRYNSLVGDMGTTLSGGQKQRLLLARALYRKPKILFLDEATSHLDTQLEYFVNEAVKKLDITRIIIAHRPETIQSADRVLVFEQGQLMDVTQQIASANRSVDVPATQGPETKEG
ncbi:peptidase domain-containing ABC transporter [Alkalimarinus alittae]|uniref:Peptidase domain-containing ABC transporter n=1 Tax=Alkalimarinus alittae TaxID=2961619 RepID=A0ABY6N1I4_9ALTE|nr:peptidase domain-containing ABC transporter [Alkalimarinus alittae]UZE95919.1 peptidase domain-containing ABC transporter [Alkalimarinus alittae]